MSERHPKHNEDRYWRLRKGSSDERLIAEMAFEQEGSHIIRQRGHKKLWSQPRNIIHMPAIYEGKWNGYDMRAIRFIKGVGRPPAELFKRSRKKSPAHDFDAQQWGF